MSLEAGLIGFAALASLALAMKKHRSGPSLPRWFAAPIARVLG